MSPNDEQSPDEPLGTETFEQGDEALDELSRLDPDFLEDVELDPRSTRPSWSTSSNSRRPGPRSTTLS